MKTSHEINARMEEIYGSMREEEIPWNRTKPPQILVDLVASGRVQPCRALDIGCGTGTYSLYLASQGFEVTGVDVSASAIRIAAGKALQQNSPARFANVNMLDDVSGVGGPFDFAKEWMILHHILPQDRQAYLKNVCRLIREGGKYLSVSFSEADRQFGTPPTGKERKSPIGPTIYCADLDELAEFFSPYFRILTAEITRIPGLKGEHTVNHLFMEKRQ